MKKINKGIEPYHLAAYKFNYPEDNWKNGFKRNAGKDGNLQVKNALIEDQKGLCAYCEIDLKLGNGLALDDFRVEHFVPENPTEDINDGVNYALSWNNLLGCCSGGNQKSIVDKESRYTNPDFSCDVPKANHNWLGVILNPVNDIPSYPRLFSYDEVTGEIQVDERICPQEIRGQAEESIIKLKLNSERLVKFRKATLDKLAEQLQTYMLEVEEDVAIRNLAEDYFNNELIEYPAFFTAIRWYLADAAEDQLNAIHF